MAFIDRLLADPVGQMAVVPFAVAFILALLLRLLGGPGLGHRLAAIGIGAGFLAAYYVMRSGFPLFPPPATNQKLFYVAAAGLGLGVVLDLAGLTRAGGHILAFLLPAGVLYWFRENQIAAGAGVSLVVTLAILYLVSIVVYWRQAASARGADTAAASSAALFPAIQVLAAGIGLGGIALLGISLGYGSLAIALAAASGGYLLVSYLAHAFGGRGLGFGATGAFGAGGAWLALLYAAVFEADAAVKLLLVAVVALVFFTDFAARPFALSAPLGAGAFARLARPILYAAVVAVPAAAALAYALVVLGWRMT